jgi:Ferritin-like
MTTRKPISRSDLLRLLTEACELEHGLACSYLYSAMTLRQAPVGQELPPDKVLLVRQWAAQVYFVASQEMLHLAQAWNLLTALGGTPYYLRPNFPQDSKYYPLHMRLALEPYGEAALNRFIGYETPTQLLKEHSFVEDMVRPRAADDPATFRTVGELYDEIENGIVQLPDAIIGEPSAQVGPDLVDFPDIVRVTNVDSAREAIHRVTHQGEGNPQDREDCHFGIFMALHGALTKEKKANPEFAPANPATINPATDTSEAYGAPRASLIAHPYAAKVAGLFDGLYSLMLRMLSYTFAPCGQMELRRTLAQGAIVLMATVIKPLGEALTALPAGSEPGRTAGPPFGLTRHVVLPVDAGSARILVAERLAELAAIARVLASSREAPSSLRRVESALQRVKNFPGIALPSQSQVGGEVRHEVTV